MKAVVKAAFYDREASLTRQVGEVFDATAARIDEINAAFPGYVERAEAPKRKKVAKEV